MIQPLDAGTERLCQEYDALTSCVILHGDLQSEPITFAGTPDWADWVIKPVLSARFWQQVELAQEGLLLIDPLWVEGCAPIEQFGGGSGDTTALIGEACADALTLFLPHASHEQETLRSTVTLHVKGARHGDEHEDEGAVPVVTADPGRETTVADEIRQVLSGYTVSDGEEIERILRNRPDVVAQLKSGTSAIAAAFGSSGEPCLAPSMEGDEALVLEVLTELDVPEARQKLRELMRTWGTNAFSRTHMGLCIGLGYR